MNADVNIVIRPARPADSAGIAGVWTDMGRYYQALDPAAFQIPGPDGLAEAFETDIRDARGDTLYLVAVAGNAAAGDAVVGFLAASLQPPGPHPERELIRDLARHRLRINILAVATEHRRHGAGTALMAEAQAWGRGHGATVVSLDTYLHSPTSVPFYERRMGYTRRAIVFRNDL